MKRFLLIICLCVVASCGRAPRIVQWVSTTADEPWRQMDIHAGSAGSGEVIDIDPASADQQMLGFGVSFSELGWQSLSLLSEQDRAAVLDELFVPGRGGNLNICRMPVGANDFSLDFYSYDETDGDFELADFSIERDRTTLLPLIKEALQRNPELQIWASPWCPPTWMKYNRHYAMRPAEVNDLPEERRGYEGQDMFVQEERYFDAYARYFGKFVDAYREEGVGIFMVMPQNEPNSDQNFPSCCWTAAGLAKFMRHLCPEMASRGVEVYFGTWERPRAEAIDTLLTDPELAGRIAGLAFQWAGRSALPLARSRYPELTYVMSEQECGDGRNDWAGACHSWELMKHYINNGVQIYDYWNISLIKNGLSRWGWRQNSLVVVDEQTAGYELSIEYYLLKHASHFVQPGARRLRLAYDNALAFANPDGTIVVVTSNESSEPLDVSLRLAGSSSLPATIPPLSFNTFVLQ